MTAFVPLPLLSNPHVQTILGNLLGSVTRVNPARPHLVTLGDGDQLVLHETSSRHPCPDGRIALLVHGLGGCARSAYMERMTRRLTDLGWRVVRMNLRGAGEGIRLARRFYTAASSPDVRAAVDHVTSEWPGCPIAVVGFSLGANIVLRFAAELACQPLSALRAVVAVAPPIDMMRCSELIARLPVYDAFYVRHLTQQVKLHQRYFPEVPRIVFPRRLSLRQFDELYTAPRWGFADALEYYGEASTVGRIAAITVPAFILTARDDPFIAVAPFERLQAQLERGKVEIHIAAHGGHLGFLGRDHHGGIRWGETQIIQWLTNRI